MVDNKGSPEERLLKVMQQEKEAQGAAKSSVPGETIGKSASAGGSFFDKIRRLLTKSAASSVDGTQAGSVIFSGKVISGLRMQGFALFKQFIDNGIDLNVVNKIFTLILIVLTAYAVIGVTNRKPNIHSLMEAISRIKFEKSRSQAVETFQAIDYYLNQIKIRDIFSPLQEIKIPVVEQPVEVVAPEPKVQIKDLIGGFKVVGIAWGDSPKAMILDNETQEVYFLEEGDFIGKTEVRINKINREKVVLGYNDEEMEL